MGGNICQEHCNVLCCVSSIFIKSQNSNLIIPILWLHEWRLRAIICLDLDHFPRVKGEELRFHVQARFLSSKATVSCAYLLTSVRLILKWVLCNYVNLC